MPKLVVISHPEVVVEPEVPIAEWSLSDDGRSRAEAFAMTNIMSSVSAIWSSTERKAVETATILAETLNLDVSTSSALGENDRSSTGYLPPSQFEAAANSFFVEPNASFRGWETALAAQNRIVTAVGSIVQDHEAGDLAIVTHGAVGTLLWCHLAREKIDRRFDQTGQGYYWTADIRTLLPDFGWRSIG